ILRRHVFSPEVFTNRLLGNYLGNYALRGRGIARGGRMMHRRRNGVGALIISVIPVLSGPAFAQILEELKQLSIDQLATVEITSVTKTAGPLSDAPASVYV